MGLIAAARGRPGWRRALPWLLLALALAGLGREALLAQQRRDWRLALDQGAVPAAAASATAASWQDDAQPLVRRFAQAGALARAGQDEAALARYRSLYDDPLLGLPARFNAANLLLRRAVALREAGQADKAYPLVELAKEGYRQVLRQAPDHRPARYNLERAQRLNPEVDAESLEVVAPEHAERAATTMRSVGQGLP